MGQDIKRMARATSENIRELRERRGYTQWHVARRLSISQNAYSKIELGLTRLTVRRLLELAELLGAAPAELLAQPPSDDGEPSGQPA